MLKNLNYKAVPLFSGMVRCKKRAHGAGTNSPPESSLFSMYR